MAVATVETIVANPARKRTRMAKRMTLKQRLHFGSARQRAAAKQALRSRRKAKSSRPHRKRSQKNPGEIIAMTLGNPARRKKAVAATKKQRRSTSKKHRAGRPRRRRASASRSNPGRSMRRAQHRTVRHRRRTNPAGYQWGDVFGLGAGAVVGSAGSSAITQLVLSTSNNGMVGYLGNLVTTFLLAWVGGMGPFRRFRGFAPGILAGGIGALMKRVIADYSLLGGYGAQLGMGDYMVSNWVTPQRLAADFRSLTDASVGQGQWGLQAPAMSSSGVSTRGLGLEGDPGTYGSVGY